MSSRVPLRTGDSVARIGSTGNDKMGDSVQATSNAAPSASRQFEGLLLEVDGKLFRIAAEPVNSPQPQGQHQVILRTRSATPQPLDEAEVRQGLREHPSDVPQPPKLQPAAYLPQVQQKRPRIGSDTYTTEQINTRELTKQQLQQGSRKTIDGNSLAEENAQLVSSNSAGTLAKRASAGDQDARTASPFDRGTSTRVTDVTVDPLQPVDEAAAPKNLRREHIEALEIPASARPANSTRKLKFQNHDAALLAASSRPKTWVPLSPDPTLPTTDKERARWALKLVLAFENTENVKNKRTYKGRWNKLHKFYSPDAIERLCYDLVHSAELLHTRGITSFAIYDPAILKEVEKTSAWTFEVRMRYLIKLLCFWKPKCVQLMKANGLEELVANPLEKMEEALINDRFNGERQDLLNDGRAAREKGQGNFISPEVQAAQDSIKNNNHTAEDQTQAAAGADNVEAGLSPRDVIATSRNEADDASADEDNGNGLIEEAEPASEGTHTPLGSPSASARKHSGDRPHPAAPAAKRTRSVSQD
ncbi:hypothetical protein EJ07DRAFT_183270 [Lizonia empirigonia]|nr:hypothetical protein EJ07DRAFT_183270 [Lizonia empirigonia]